MFDTVYTVFLWPFHWKTVQILITALILLPVGLVVYGLYRLIIWKMNERMKSTFHRILLIAGIAAGVLFFIQGALTLITQHHINVQLGFRTATPDGPEGEPFIVYRVVEGMTMDISGLMEEDTIRMGAVTQLYKLLIKNQGNEAYIPVIRDNEEITVIVKVPVLDVPLAKYSLFL